MLLPPDSAFRFINGYKAVLLEVLKASGATPGGDIIRDLSAARSHAKQRQSSITEALFALEARGSAIDADVVRALQTLKVAQWVYLRDSAQYSVFIDMEVQNAYAVKALTIPIRRVASGCPATFEAGLFEFCGHYVCDGIIVNPVYLGTNYKSQFNAAYASIRKAGKFHAKAAVSPPLSGK